VLRAKVGRVFTDGMNVIDIGGHEPATLLKVESIGGSEGLKFLGAKLVGPHRSAVDFTSLDGWPTVEGSPPLIEPVGATLEPTVKTWNRHAYELVMGYRIIRATYAERVGVRVTYKIGDHVYQATLPRLISICPPGRTLTSCLDAGSATAKAGIAANDHS